LSRRILNNVNGEDPKPFADVPIPWTVLRPVQADEITVTVPEVVALGRAVLDYAPGPLPPDLADILTAVVYRCNSALFAAHNPDWIALREQLFSPGSGPFLDYLGGVIRTVSTLAERLDIPVIHAVLRQLEDLFEKVQLQTRDAPLLAAAEKVYMRWIQQWIEQVDEAVNLH
jgi:hypothetical protein